MASSAPKLFDLSARTKLRVTGSDRTRYLNGQITNEIRKATSESALYAAVLNAKGRMDADVFVHPSGDSFLIDADATLREQLPARLDRYVIADDVQITDVTEQFALYHVVGAVELGRFGRVIGANRFGCVGSDVWLEAAEREMVIQQLATACEIYDYERAETFRIERGVPRWGCELSNDIIPVEANLEPTAIDYAKGCYIGQEVISRMKMSGQTNKRLRGLVSRRGAPLRSGMRLVKNDDETREVGWITSATRSENLQREIALGFVKRGYNDPGTSLLAESCEVEVVDLPFI